ncbi:hypothetical protein D920_02851 [Enterococcus faecalis 13-SD-W-01]|nr:hypothetical protein D920_02851 [Enterococcus faecalis 13-SD-W-01]
MFLSATYSIPKKESLSNKKYSLKKQYFLFLFCQKRNLLVTIAPKSTHGNMSFCSVIKVVDYIYIK